MYLRDIRPPVWQSSYNRRLAYGHLLGAEEYDQNRSYGKKSLNIISLICRLVLSLLMTTPRWITLRHLVGTDSWEVCLSRMSGDRYLLWPWRYLPKALSGRATYSSNSCSLCISWEISNLYVRSNPPIKRRGSLGPKRMRDIVLRYRWHKLKPPQSISGPPPMLGWPQTWVLCLLSPSFSVVWSSRWGCMRWPYQVRKILHTMERKANLTLEAAENVRWIWHLLEAALPSQINTLVNKMMKLNLLCVWTLHR